MTTTTWDLRRAATNLGVKLVPFNTARLDPATTRGYSYANDLAVREQEPHPLFIALHELGHIVLGHSNGIYQQFKSEFGLGTEVEAHTIALVLAKRLQLQEGIEYIKADELDYLDKRLVRSLYTGPLDPTLIETVVPAIRAITKAGLLR